MVGAEPGCPARDGLIEEGNRALELAVLLVSHGQIVEGREGIGMVGAQLDDLGRECFFQKGDDEIEPAGTPVAQREVVLNGERIGVVAAETGGPELPRAFKLLDRQVRFPEDAVSLAQDMAHGGFDGRLILERRGDPGLGGVDGLADGCAGPEPPVLALGPGCRQHLVLEERQDGLRLGGGAPGLFTLDPGLALGPRGPDRLPGAHHGPQDQDAT